MLEHSDARIQQRQNEMNKTDSIAPHEEVKSHEPACMLNMTFDRIEVGVALNPDAARRSLNKLHRALQGISGITQILIANNVADGCCEPALNGFLTASLVAAANSLSEFAVDEIEDLTDRAEKRAQDQEGGHD